MEQMSIAGATCFDEGQVRDAFNGEIISCMLKTLQDMREQRRALVSTVSALKLEVMPEEERNAVFARLHSIDLAIDHLHEAVSSCEPPPQAVQAYNAASR